MLSAAFLRHAFRIVPFTHWPVLIWHIIMVHDWMARLTAAGEPIPFLTVRRNGVIYRRAPDAPADHWRNQLHSIDHARCTDAVRAHLAAHHGREAGAYFAARQASPACPGLAHARRTLACLRAAGLPVSAGHTAPAARAELPLPPTPDPAPMPHPNPAKSPEPPTGLRPKVLVSLPFPGNSTVSIRPRSYFVNRTLDIALP